MTAVIDIQTFLLILLLLNVVDALVLHFFLEGGALLGRLLLEDRVDLGFDFERWDEAAVPTQVENGQDLVERMGRNFRFLFFGIVEI